MNVTDAYFPHKRIIEDRLIPFGFIKKGEGFLYVCPIVDGQMRMRVFVIDGHISANVYDPDTFDEYTLHAVAGSGGEFVGRVRADFERVLTSIAENCCESEIYHFSDTKRIILYVKESFGDELEFLWDDLPDAAVLRRKDNRKWYAIIMRVRREKLGIGEGFTEVMNVQAPPEAIDSIVDGKRYLRGYHMNKKHWLSIVLEGGVPFEEICERLKVSYALAAKKK